MDFKEIFRTPQPPDLIGGRVFKGFKGKCWPEELEDLHQSVLRVLIKAAPAGTSGLLFKGTTEARLYDFYCFVPGVAPVSRSFVSLDYREGSVRFFVGVYAPFDREASLKQELDALFKQKIKI